MTAWDVLSYAALCLGAAILAYALKPASRNVKELPAGRLRDGWRLLRALIVFFIASYLAYGGIGMVRGIAPAPIPAVIMLFGAGFVLLVSQLALLAVPDQARISVLEEESTTDALTGIRNRRYYDERFEDEVVRARRYDAPLSLLMLDIDHFKKVNDQYGHAAGDRVLRAFGALLRERVRYPDVAARVGGEELAVLLPNTGIKGAAMMAERLRHEVEQSSVPSAGGSDAPSSLRFTVSVGVAMLERDDASAEQLAKRADEALYRAKYEGRNRVVVKRSEGARSAGGTAGNS